MTADDELKPRISLWAVASGTLLVASITVVVIGPYLSEHCNYLCEYCLKHRSGTAVRLAGNLWIAAIACAIMTYIAVWRYRVRGRTIAHVVTVLSVFSVVVLPTFLEDRMRSSMRPCIANMRNLDSAIQQCMIENPSATNIVLENLVPKYLKRVPIYHPSHQKYIVTNVNGEFTVVCPAAGTYTDHVL